ncbi:MAG: mechanosensitive ion channel [Rhodospirillales bacterium]|nr:mechanosensitive ion channel [Rhodospirillales bacterium]
MIDLMIEVVATYGLDVIGAVVILIFGWMAAGWCSGVTAKALARTGKIDVMIQHFLANAVRYAVLIFTLLAVLDRFGVETTSFIAILGATGLAIGLAMQGALSNVAAGVMLLFFRPFKVGDFIDGGGQSGTVKSVSLFLTYLNTPDNVEVIIPNSQLWNAAIKNYSFNETRRLDLLFGIGYGDDIDKAMAIIQGIIDADERCRKEPEPVIVVGNLGESSVDIIVRVWCKGSDYWGLKWHMLKTVKQTFDKQGVSIPFPQRDVHLIGADKD